jgi:serralysin
LPTTIIGTNGDDTLQGTPGTDLMKGLGGNDILLGSLGSDWLFGGPGKDTFKFLRTVDADRDAIGDFRGSQGDKIDLSKIDARIGHFWDRGDQAFDWVGNIEHKSLDIGQLGYRQVGKDVMVYGNTDLNPNYNFSFKVTDHTALTGSDFIL